MILPITAYGTSILKKVAEPITAEYLKLEELLTNMFETMYDANGVGLAAPQIGLSIRLFIIDASPFAEDEEVDNSHLADFKKIFINPTILGEDGEAWSFEEGCLSIPGIREAVDRQAEVTINYFDENFQEHTETYDGFAARVIQHEYDHVEGILFTDKISPLKKSLLKSKLANIAKGKVNVGYKMKFPQSKRR
jgi:peptide deformylase